MIKLTCHTIMEKVLVLMLLMFTPVAAANEEDLSFSFSSDSGKYWQYISDQTMGGVSSGQVTLEQDGDLSFARLTGNLSTSNNGGFIQLRLGVSFATSEEHDKALRGVRLNVRGNGETYNIFIRTNETRSYSDYYSASFKTGTNWEVIELPFEQFKRKRSLN
jgi:hypothetical protein